MADIFAPAPEPKSELGKYRLLAPKCGRKYFLQITKLGPKADG